MCCPGWPQTLGFKSDLSVLSTWDYTGSHTDARHRASAHGVAGREEAGEQSVQERKWEGKGEQEGQMECCESHGL